MGAQVSREKQATINQEKKQSLKELRRQYNISLTALAEQAGILPREEYLLEIGVAVEKQIAMNVLNAFSQLVEQTYTLDMVWVSVKKERQK